jgi:hypothetical protein
LQFSARMRFTTITFTVPVLLFAGCASSELVRADDMSAAQHRMEAERENEAAAQAAQRYKPPAAAPVSTTDPPGYDANEEHRREAASRREHARQHESAAEFLEHFEDRECRHVPPASRAACPLLGPVIRIEDVWGGIRAWFTDEKRAATVIAEMRCHYAYARSRHFDEAIGCPLYVRGVEIHQALDSKAIEIIARDEKTVHAIRERGRQQAVFAPEARR